MIELPLVFAAGIMGAAHCLGMCGPFALTIGGTSQDWYRALTRQLSYTAGRVFTYGTLGVAAGSCGTWIAHVWTDVVNIPAMLAIAAGTLLVYQGLAATGLLRRRAVRPTVIPCLAGGFLGQFLRQPKPRGLFLAGLFTGFLPCGLLYGMLGLAMSTHSAAWGGLTMVVFGLGTAPAMISAGISGRVLGFATRQHLFAVAAWCLVFTGAISIARGASFLAFPTKAADRCPMCRLQR